mmetsp:Transcript_65315/g.96603  ORF Transcript_65315/g.96603 Transcript_65315/m.96603 type:complete len:245 (+) Transcript_65315:956-1690(+)
MTMILLPQISWHILHPTTCPKKEDAHKLVFLCTLRTITIITIHQQQMHVLYSHHLTLLPQPTMIPIVFYRIVIQNITMISNLIRNGIQMIINLMITHTILQQQLPPIQNYQQSRIALVNELVLFWRIAFGMMLLLLVLLLLHLPHLLPLQPLVHPILHNHIYHHLIHFQLMKLIVKEDILFDIKKERKIHCYVCIHILSKEESPHSITACVGTLHHSWQLRFYLHITFAPKARISMSATGAFCL